VGFLKPGSTLVVAVVCAAGCATPMSVDHRHLVVSDGGAVVYAGPAAWTMRATSADHEDVVEIEGLGEVLVQADGCRLVRSLPNGLIRVTMSSPAMCAERRGDSLCFLAHTQFVEPDSVVAVHGCADRNELVFDRLTSGAQASVGPTSLLERCIPVPAHNPVWVRIRDVAVDDNDRPERGLRLRYRDGFRVCVLTRPGGRYRMVVDVEDPTPRRLVLTGAIDDVDDD
jgi:hypothetical protein